MEEVSLQTKLSFTKTSCPGASDESHFDITTSKVEKSTPASDEQTDGRLSERLEKN